jgi:membrane protein YqaA with SNARE-associated domain
MSTSWWAPIAMLFVSPALTSAARPRSRDSLLRLLGADLVVIALVVSIRAIKPGDELWIGIFYMAALAALLLTGSLAGATARYGIGRWYGRFVARRASS